MPEDTAAQMAADRAAVEQIIEAHLADAALVRELILLHVCGLHLPCRGVGLDGRACCDQEEPA